MIAIFYSLSIIGICQLSTVFAQQNNGNGTVDPTNCTSGKIWDADLTKCVKDCTTAPNSQNVFDSANTDQCLCITNFGWDSASSACIRNCQGVLNSNNQN